MSIIPIFTIFFSINQGLLLFNKGAVKLQLCFDFCCWFCLGIGIERGGASKVDLGDKYASLAQGVCPI